jgi:hypothetical protein
MARLPAFVMEFVALACAVTVFVAAALDTPPVPTPARSTAEYAKG